VSGRTVSGRTVMKQLNSEAMLEMASRRMVNVAEALKDFTDDDLRHELQRRRCVTKRERPRRFCDDCVHFNVWTGGLCREVPKDWPPCKLGHVCKFMCPEVWAPYSENWGFFRVGCKDYKRADESAGQAGCLTTAVRQDA
jgi:hypothetical protein